MMQMQFSGGHGSGSSSAGAPLMKGGGVIPPVLLEESRIPRFYKDAIASCGAANASQLPNTTAVYNLMVASGLPRPMLSYIWTIVNRTLPGQLTRQEFYSCLALIALAQKGQTLSALSFVTTLPVPQLQLPHPYGNQRGQSQPAPNAAAVSVGLPGDCFGAIPSTSTAAQASMIPASISVQNFGKQQFPSAAQSAALNFTRSLDLQSSQKAAASATCSPQPGNLGIPLNVSTNTAPTVMKSSQSIPAFVNMAVPPAVASGPAVTVASPGSTYFSGQISNPKGKPTASALRHSPNAHPLRPQLESPHVFDSTDSKGGAPPNSSLDLLLDFSMPSTSNRQPNGSSVVPSTSLLEDEFGDLTVSQSPVSISAKRSVVSPANLGSQRPSPAAAKPDFYDVYAAVKTVEGKSDIPEDSERIAVWKRCIGEAYKIFQNAHALFSTQTAESVEIVARTERGSRYFSALMNVYEMVSRICKDRENELSGEMEHFREIRGIWERWRKLTTSAENSLKHAVNGLIVKRCGICLVDIADEALLEFAGTEYHKQCANLWTNRVDPVLPKLS